MVWRAAMVRWNVARARNVSMRHQEKMALLTEIQSVKRFSPDDTCVGVGAAKRSFVIGVIKETRVSHALHLV